MIGVWYCLRNQHDWRLVCLAGFVCTLASLAAVTILRQQHGQSPRVDRRWRIVAGITTGFGIWSTHFLAMLGYKGAGIVGYDVHLTAVSLLVAISMTMLGFSNASERGDPRRLIGGGVAVGTGITAMHYLGMNAVEFPGHFAWAPGPILLSLICAIAFAIPALALALRRRGIATGIASALALMLAILTLHFIGMSAVSVVPDAGDIQASLVLSPVSLGLVIGALALAVLLIGASAAVMNMAALAAIHARGREFQILVQGITDCALYLLDRDGRIASWNAGAERLKGLTSDEAIGLHFSTFYGETDRAENLPARALNEARTTGKFTAEGWRHRKDGSRFWAHVTIEPVADEQGTIVAFAKITRDMSRQKEDQDRLMALTAKLDAALTNMHQGLVLYDPRLRVALVNARFRQMYQLGPDEPLEGLIVAQFMRTALRARGGVLVNDDRIAAGEQWMHACLSQPDGGTVTITYEDGSVVDISYRSLPDGGVVATFEDVSERHRSEARIAHMALHDGLTGLPNRLSFNERLDTLIARAAAEQSKVAIVEIDLDGFKEINDTHGHAVGDRVLQALGQRLGEVVSQDAMAARFGGDEFVACRIFADDAELRAFTDRLLAMLDAPVVLDALSIRPDASIGIAVYPDDGGDREQIFNNADLAMYRAKANPGQRVCRYEYGMDESARSRRAMAKDLRDAVARDELSLAFQVQRSVASGEVTGYEALLRWEHPTQGWIPPQDFIAVAEESGSILEIGEWVLRRACQEAARWQSPHRVAVNLSPVQFVSRELPATLAQILLETGLPPSRLELEITETAIIADKAGALHTLRQIKMLGVTIAIDDFGTGYSSLETLNSFPFDKIKIDRSFIGRSEQSVQARAIIRAVIALGTSLRMPVLAEGVENEGQLSFLRSEGCAEVQGFLLGRPSFEVSEEDRPARGPVLHLVR